MVMPAHPFHVVVAVSKHRVGLIKTYRISTSTGRIFKVLLKAIHFKVVQITRRSYTASTLVSSLVLFSFCREIWTLERFFKIERNRAMHLRATFGSIFRAVPKDMLAMVINRDIGVFYKSGERITAREHFKLICFRALKIRSHRQVNTFERFWIVCIQMRSK